MTQASLFSPVNTSRMVGVLAEFDIVNGEISRERFGERLGKLIEFSDSFALSDAHYYIDKMQAQSGGEGEQERQQRAKEIIDEFLRIRKLLVRAVVKSFAPDGKTRFKAPKPRAEDSIDEALKYEPYRRFYAIQQREMDIQVQNLRKFVRETISDMSLNLQKLAALDKALGDTLHVHASKQLAKTPKLLQQRFIELQDAHGARDKTITEWLAPKGWLAEYHRDMQKALLAELDLRLSPVLGMVEALNEEVNKQHD